MGNMALIIDDDQKLRNLYVNAADAMPTGGDLYLKTVNVTDKDMIGNLN
jgi:hypothetical protein